MRRADELCALNFPGINIVLIKPQLATVDDCAIAVFLLQATAYNRTLRNKLVDFGKDFGVAMEFGFDKVWNEAWAIKVNDVNDTFLDVCTGAERREDCYVATFGMAT